MSIETKARDVSVRLVRCSKCRSYLFPVLEPVPMNGWMGTGKYVHADAFASCPGGDWETEVTSLENVIIRNANAALVLADPLRGRS